MLTELYDTHAHLDDPVFQADLEAVLERAQVAGVARVVSIGTDVESSERAVALAERHPGVYAAVGWHPSYIAGAPEDIRADLRRLATHPKVVALGETGVDVTRVAKPERPAVLARQQELMRQHFEVAAETGLNVVIHQRELIETVLEELARVPEGVKAVLHCFVDLPAFAQRVIDLGHFVSFTGISTFKNGENVRAAAAAVPAGRFMLETDSPYLAPVPYRGKRCEPSYVVETARVLAEARGCSLAQLGSETCAAARLFFPKLK